MCQEFCPGGGVCLSACWDTPPGSRHPPLPGTPPGPGTPRPGTPREQTPPGPDTPSQTPLPDQTPPREADCSIRSTSGRYASYWNAFLLIVFLKSRDQLPQKKDPSLQTIEGTRRYPWGIQRLVSTQSNSNFLLVVGGGVLG